MKIAIEGCAHGELDKIYEAIDFLEKENNVKIDLLIICGDFQAVRNPADLESMAVPPKFRKLNTFYKYYSGAKTAPILTIFVGGNHEASNYLSELPYGGWVCPNIYYMGYANVIKIGGIRIAGLSGIYKGNDYLKGHFECPPYDEASKRSVYHVRNVDVFRLKQIKSHIDIVISHDWPRGVYNYGNKNALLQHKKFFREEVENNKLGSPAAEELLEILKPSYWFAAHLHCKFAALVPHRKGEETTFTKFLALDKCLPGRKFLQILDIGCETPLHIEYDPEWLCILRSTDHLLSISRRNNYMSSSGDGARLDFTVSENEINDIIQLFNSDLKVPCDFVHTASPYDATQQNSKEETMKPYINPQTENFCKILKVTNPLSALIKSNNSLNISEFSNTDTDVSSSTFPSLNPDEISVSDDDDDDVTNEMTPLENETDPDSSGASNDKMCFNISDAEEFYIDKIGSNISLNARQFLESQLCSTPLSAMKSNTLKDFEFPELKTENLDTHKPETDNVEENSLLKKFKRRNWSLYKSEEDESEPS